MDSPKVTIIGGGLSAVYAYWGCLDAGYRPLEIQVLYTDIKTPPGAVFMYESPIPWPWKKVTSVLVGTCDQYSINQWDEVRQTSAHKRFENGEENYRVEYLVLPNDILATLWGMIPYKAQSPIFTFEDLDKLKVKRHAIICTFANENKRKEYKNRGFITSFPIYINQSPNNDYVVIYNGLKHVPWVRETLIPGRIQTEYASVVSHDSIMRYEFERDNMGGKIHVSPDLHPDCIPLEWEERIEGNLFRIGRFSSFIPGYLSHQARGETCKFLQEL